MNISCCMRKRNLYLLLIADFISSFGSIMTGNAITLIVYRRTGDLFSAALFVIVTLLPKTIITPFLNRIHLHASFKKIFCIGELFCGLMIGVFLVKDSIMVIFSIYSVFGIAFFLLECYRAEFLKIITNDEEIYRYQSISRIVNVLVTVLAPLVAGAILSYTSSEKYIYAIDIVTYFVAALIILFIDGNIKPVERTRESGEKKCDIRNILYGRAFIFFGSTIISLVGGITSLLTLSYIVNILKLGEFQYSILMALMAFGGLIGSSIAMIPQIARNIKQISSASTFLMGILLLTVIFIPKFGSMCVICVVSGTLSSLIMVYYSTELFVKCEESEIKSASGYFGICMDLTEMVSKPIAGGLDRLVGSITSLILMGVCFIICTPINYKLEKESDVKYRRCNERGK